MNNKKKINIIILVLVICFVVIALYIALSRSRSKTTEPQENTALPDSNITEPNLPAVTEQTEQEQEGGLTERQQRALKWGFPDLLVFDKPPPEKDPFRFSDRELIDTSREWKSLTGEGDLQDFRFSMVHAPNYAKMELESLFSGYKCFYTVTMRGVVITAVKIGTEEWERSLLTGFDITYWFPDSNEPNDTVACTVEAKNYLCKGEVIKKMECQVRDILKGGLKKRCEFVKNNPRYLELSRACVGLLEDIGRTKITEYEEIKKMLGKPVVQKPPRTYTISTGDKDIRMVYDEHAKIEAVSMGTYTFVFDSETMTERIKRIGTRCLVDDIDVDQLLILHDILCQVDKHFD